MSMPSGALSTITWEGESSPYSFATDLGITRVAELAPETQVFVISFSVLMVCFSIQPFILEGMKELTSNVRDPWSHIPILMTQQKSKLICLCGTEGGVLTRRRAGNSKKKKSLYNQHYDPTKKAGKRPCYISKQNLALIRLNDERYSREYEPLVKCYYEILRDYSSPRDNAVVDLLEHRACRLLCDMGWPDKVVKGLDKFRADARELYVMEIVQRYEISRERVFKTYSKFLRDIFPVAF
jgi:hypothetical protein